MLIAQVTDLHLGFDKDDPDEPNLRRFGQTLKALLALKPRPDLLLLTGDLAETGDETCYRQLKESIAAMPFPVFLALGNHDRREAFKAQFPDVPCADGFVQYAIEDYPVRILVLDTLDEARHRGAFCTTRAAWLAERLAEQPERPTMIVLHHPPIETGLSWMTENPDAVWVERLELAVSPHRNVVRLIAGHLHRTVISQFAGTILTVCAASSAHLALDLGTIDPETPDGRDMVVAGVPAFALHLWTGRSLVTHFGTATEDQVLARFDAAMQPLVRKLASETKGA